MIFSDYTEESMTNFDAVLANYGVERTEGIVIEEIPSITHRCHIIWFRQLTAQMRSQILLPRDIMC